MYKKIILFACLSVMLISCGNQASNASSNSQLTNSIGSAILRDNGAEPVIINADKKEIIIEAIVNGKYFTNPSRHHGIVFEGGKYGDRAVLIGLSDEREVYQALIDIGAIAGNNLKLEEYTKVSKNVDGQQLDVYVTWDGLGKEIPFAEIIKSDDVRDMDIRFGGNFEAAKDNRTGCILCLDSCPIAITSDAAYATAELENKKIDKFIREDILPKDGERVSVIFRIK
ncbi:YdjY domain-containing protein [Brachyspira sp. SAP_772]|uniref:YdjY domain-containing protein n=1 Tax=Brachyspira sp. SAP_772 TaxID=2608385 RepID=UPI0012F4D5D1|nr:YdjY domain-containing protein [Brachyspira sp. SAP_772]